MEICAGSRPDRHDEIVFEGGDCPVCSRNELLEQAQKDIETIKNSLTNLITNAENALPPYAFDMQIVHASRKNVREWLDGLIRIVEDDIDGIDLEPR